MMETSQWKRTGRFETSLVSWLFDNQSIDHYMTARARNLHVAWKISFTCIRTVSTKHIYIYIYVYYIFTLFGKDENMVN